MTAIHSGKGYWATQITACAVGATALPALGIGFLSAGTDEPGRGLILILAGFMFLGCLVWLVRSYRRMSTTQRAVYAWAITQQHGSADQRGIGSDVEMMASAAKASKGQLTHDELLGLAALRPENPYPGTMPPAESLLQ